MVVVDDVQRFLLVDGFGVRRGGHAIITRGVVWQVIVAFGEGDMFTSAAAELGGSLRLQHAIERLHYILIAVRFVGCGIEHGLGLLLRIRVEEARVQDPVFVTTSGRTVCLLPQWSPTR